MKKLLSLPAARRWLYPIAIFIFFSMPGQLFAQLHPLGAIPLSQSDYDKLPRANWDSLRKYSNTATIASQSAPNARAGYTMLINPPVGDQGTEGSCVGWAVGYSAMGILMYPRYNSWNTAERSPNYVFNQIRQGGNDCSIGSYPKDALNLVKTQGDCSWNLMPYVDGACTALPNATQIADAGQNVATQWTTLGATDVSGIKQALDLGFPVVAVFNVYTSFDNMWSTGGGIWSVPNSGTNRGSHAVCIIGYDDTRQMFKMQNQWGTFGGDNGYIWVSYNGIQNYGYFSELYVLYAANQASPMSITGDNVVCTTSTNYTVSNLPAGATVTWTASPAAVATINSPNATQTTITSNGTYGVVTLTATVSIPGGPPVVLTSTPIAVNKPYPIGIAGYSNLTYCEYYDFAVLAGGGSSYPYYGQLQVSVYGATSYSWSVQNNTNMYWSNLGNGAVSAASKLSNGSLTLLCRASNSCGSTSQYFYFQPLICNQARMETPVAEPNINPMLAVYPNPVTDKLTITLPNELIAGHAAITITDIYGRQIQRQEGVSNKTILSVASLAPGIYMVQVHSGNKLLITKKIVKN